MMCFCVFLLIDLIEWCYFCDCFFPRTRGNAAPQDFGGFTNTTEIVHFFSSQYGQNESVQFRRVQRPEGHHFSEAVYS